MNISADVNVDNVCTMLRKSGIVYKHSILVILANIVGDINFYIQVIRICVQRIDIKVR